MSELARLARLASALREQGVDRLLVSAPVNVRYLCGYTGSNGLLLVDSGERTEHRFFTDFRYVTQAAEQLPGEIEREIAPGELLEVAARALGEGGATGTQTLGFDDASLTVKQHARLRELLAAGWELVPCSGIVERLREVKDEQEIERIRAASKLADQALSETLEAGLLGRTEREVAIDLELRMRRLGAQAPSFPSIVASGEHGALPHAEPRDVEIAAGVLVTIDWGAYLDGYCSDCTRTYATGKLSADAVEVYETVLSAQEAGLQAVRAGISGREVDEIARTIIDSAGHSEHFGHGLGHGVGMEIHEAPRLSRTASEEPLRAGNIVTVEPGVYVPGSLGVRIEDLVLIGEAGSERLTSLPKQLITLD
ncbi:MAG TPA: Xaa-Pro peptidase family protein [Solirubrobacteraceae bacterium]|jgi:Xaa-Pro aminopeptidase|nr:Xaa-Pro peptidase family protein [Solirubrobacteraceae bacterium]